MREKDLDKVLNYMKQYVENIYEHDSEPMLNWKDLKLVLEEIERLNNIIDKKEIFLGDNIKRLEREVVKRDNIIKEVRNQLDYLETYSSKEDVFEDMKRRLDRIDKIIGSDKE